MIRAGAKVAQNRRIVCSWDKKSIVMAFQGTLFIFGLSVHRPSLEQVPRREGQSLVSQVKEDCEIVDVESIE